MRLEFHPEAELDLIEAAVHYEVRVPGLGGRFESEVRRATDLLLEHPGSVIRLTQICAGSFCTGFHLRFFTAWLLMYCASRSLHTKAAYRATGDQELTGSGPIHPKGTRGRYPYLSYLLTKGHGGSNRRAA